MNAFLLEKNIKKNNVGGFLKNLNQTLLVCQYTNGK